MSLHYRARLDSGLIPPKKVRSCFAPGKLPERKPVIAGRLHRDIKYIQCRQGATDLLYISLRRQPVKSYSETLFNLAANERVD